MNKREAIEPIKDIRGGHFDAWEELQNFLYRKRCPGERIEKIIFGDWRRHDRPDPSEGWAGGLPPADPGKIPYDKRGVLLSGRAARPLMWGWSFYGPDGHYSVYVWTNRRVIFTVMGDDGVMLDCVPRYPVAGEVFTVGAWWCESEQ